MDDLSRIANARSHAKLQPSRAAQKPPNYTAEEWAAFKESDWSKQMELYFDICEITSKIVMCSRDNPDRRTAELKFFELNLNPVGDYPNVLAAFQRLSASLVASADKKTLAVHSAELVQSYQDFMASQREEKLRKPLHALISMYEDQAAMKDE